MKAKHPFAAIVPAVLMLGSCEDQQATKRYEFREDKSGHLMRLNNSTGEATIADDQGSHQILPPNDTSAARILTPEELSKVTGNAACNADVQSFQGRLYNGTGVVLRSVGIIITHKKFFPEDEVIWKRQIIVRDLYIRPLEVKAFVAPLVGVESSKCEWIVSHAYGSPWQPEASWWDRLTR
jgi:hypothetical protein